MDEIQMKSMTKKSSRPGPKSKQINSTPVEANTNPKNTWHPKGILNIFSPSQAPNKVPKIDHTHKEEGKEKIGHPNVHSYPHININKQKPQTQMPGPDILVEPLSSSNAGEEMYQGVLLDDMDEIESSTPTEIEMIAEEKGGLGDINIDKDNQLNVSDTIQNISNEKILPQQDLELIIPNIIPLKQKRNPKNTIIYTKYKIRSIQDARDLKMTNKRNLFVSVHIKLIQYNENTMTRLKQFLCEATSLEHLKISIYQHFKTNFDTHFEEFLGELQECPGMKSLIIQGKWRSIGVMEPGIDFGIPFIRNSSLKIILSLQHLNLLKLKNVSIECGLQDLITHIQGKNNVPRLHTLSLINIYSKNNVNPQLDEFILTEELTNAVCGGSLTRKLWTIRAKWRTLYDDYWGSQIRLLSGDKLGTLDVKLRSDEKNSGMHIHKQTIPNILAKNTTLGRVKFWKMGSDEEIFRAIIESLQSHLSLQRLFLDSEDRVSIFTSISELLSVNQNIKCLKLRGTSYPHGLALSHIHILDIYGIKFADYDQIEVLVGDLSNVLQLRCLKLREFGVLRENLDIEEKLQLSKLLFKKLGGCKKLEKVIITEEKQGQGVKCSENVVNNSGWTMDLSDIINLLKIAKPRNVLQILKLRVVVRLKSLNTLCKYFDKYTHPPTQQPPTEHVKHQFTAAEETEMDESSSSLKEITKDNFNLPVSENPIQTGPAYIACGTDQDSTQTLKLKIIKDADIYILGEIVIQEEPSTLHINLERILRITRKMHITGEYTANKLTNKQRRDINKYIYKTLRSCLMKGTNMNTLNILKLSFDSNLPYLPLLKLIQELPKPRNLRKFLLKNISQSKDCEWIFQVMGAISDLDIVDGGNPRYCVIYNRIGGGGGKCMSLSAGAGTKFLDRVEKCWKPKTNLSLCDVRILRKEYNEKLKLANQKIVVYQSTKLLVYHSNHLMNK